MLRSYCGDETDPNKYSGTSDSVPDFKNNTIYISQVGSSANVYAPMTPNRVFMHLSLSIIYGLLFRTRVQDSPIQGGKGEKKAQSIIILLKMVLEVTEQVIFDLFRHRLMTEQVENDLFCHQSQIRPFSRIVYTSRMSNP